MQRKHLRRLAGSRATALAAMVVMAIALIIAFTLADWNWGIVSRAERDETALIALDTAIGATFEPLDRATAESLGLSEWARGLVITSLDGNGPAARVGIRAGDVIERIDGAPVGSVSDVAAVLERAPGRDFIVLVNRHGHYVIVRLPIRSVLAANDLLKQGDER
jgi:membrane-associated protease RseP (regulator of RpoE activity)